MTGTQNIHSLRGRFFAALRMTGERFFATLRMTAAALLAALCLAGCAKSIILDDGESSIPMQFGVYSARSAEATKADDSYVAPGVTTLPYGSSFGVFAFYQEGTVGSGTPAAWSASRTPDFMFAQKVSFDGSAYSYSPIRYWPANEENTISFWAYYPYGAYSTDNTGALKFYSDAACTSAYTASSTGLPVAKYTVPENPANQSDILFDSFTQQDKTYANCSPTEGTVPLSFRHVLCAVQFAVAMPSGAGSQGDLDEKVGGSYAHDYSFTFTDLTINGLPREGICTDVSAATVSWTTSGSFDASSTVYNPSTGRTDNFILLPTTLGDGITLDATMELKFRAEDDPDNRSADLVYPFTVTGLKLNTIEDASNTAITVWETGKRYVYTLQLSLDRIEFSAEVSDWDSEFTVSITE